MSSLAARPRRPRGEGTMALGVAALAAGVAVLLATVIGAGQVPDHEHGGATGTTLLDHLGMAAGMAVPMTLVMMSPFAVPLAGAVSRATVWWRSRRAAAAAVVAYLGLWVLVAVVLHLAGALVMPLVTPVGAVAGLTVAAVAEQLSRGRTRVLAACQATRPVREADAIRNAAGWGLGAAVRCVRACGLPMALMAVQPGLVSFVGVTALLWAERFGPRPRPRVLLAAGYLMLGVGQSVWMVIQR